MAGLRSDAKDVRNQVPESSKQWCVYILRCCDDTLYTGCTNSLSKRISDHNGGRGAKYTKTRLPVRLEWHKNVGNKSEALKLEYKIKQLKRSQKLLLIEGEYEI